MDEKARQARARYYRQRRATMTEEQKEKKREYRRKYRMRNRDKINAYEREWHRGHPEKRKEYQERYWTRRAEREEDAGVDYKGISPTDTHDTEES